MSGSYDYELGGFAVDEDICFYIFGISIAFDAGLE